MSPLAAAERHRVTVAPDGERAEEIELDSAHGGARLYSATRRGFSGPLVALSARTGRLARFRRDRTASPTRRYENVRRLITARALLVLACLGALAASAPLAAARAVAAGSDPGALAGTWKRVVTQADIDRTASFREEPAGWEPPLTGPYTLVLANGSFSVRDKAGFAVAQTTRVDSGGAFDVLAYIDPGVGAFCPQWIPQNASYTWAAAGREARADAGRRPLCRPQLHPGGRVDAREQRPHAGGEGDELQGGKEEHDVQRHPDRGRRAGGQRHRHLQGRLGHGLELSHHAAPE